MIRPVMIATALLAFGGAVAIAQTLPAPPAPKPALMALTPQDIDPVRLLPPPASFGSDAQKAELAELHRIQDQRTPARLDQAVWDQDHQEWHMYVQLLGPKFDMAALPATAKVLAVVQNDNKIAADRAKTFFKRRRPWADDKSLQGCPVKPSDDPLSSYPSGHTAYGYSTGVVLADLMPDKAQAILERAQDFAYSRLVCGVHYRSDTQAGEALGTVVAQDLLHSPKMQADLAAARAELKAAGLAG